MEIRNSLPDPEQEFVLLGCLIMIASIVVGSWAGIEVGLKTVNPVVGRITFVASTILVLLTMAFLPERFSRPRELPPGKCPRGLGSGREPYMEVYYSCRRAGGTVVGNRPAD